MFGFIGVTEGIIIIAIVLIIFGAGKLPHVGKAMGEAIQNFKKSTSGEDSEDTHRK